MNKKYVILIVIGFCLLVTIITNPSVQKHREEVKKVLKSFVDKRVGKSNDDNSKASEEMGNLFAGLFIDKMIESSVSSDNYLFFSLTKITKDDKSKTIGIGILGNVFLSKDINELKDY